MSSPTSCLLFCPPSNHISWPLSLSPAPRLAAPHMCLAHLAFHPAVQDRLTKFPTIAELECGNLAFGDVTVQSIRGDPQILRRLPHIHHFTRFIHEERYPSARTRPISNRLGAPQPTLRNCGGAPLPSVMTSRD